VVKFKQFVEVNKMRNAKYSYLWKKISLLALILMFLTATVVVTTESFRLASEDDGAYPDGEDDGAYPDGEDDGAYPDGEDDGAYPDGEDDGAYPDSIRLDWIDS
jgi:hypothetical protein